VSDENVETLRRSNAAFNRGDRDAAFADYHPEVDWRDLQPAPDSPELLHGVAAVEEYWALWTEAFDDVSAEVEEYIDAGSCVLTVTHWRAKGRGTGLVVDLKTVDVFEFADGKIARATMSYADKDSALEAIQAGG
jgi:ketosteroid isomerase-like protein